MRRAVVIGAIAGMLVLPGAVARAGGGCHDPEQTEMTVASLGDVADVDYKGMCAYPNVLNVQAGQTVTWHNTDPFEHTVTSGSGGWADQTLEQGDTFEHTFTEAGLYPFYCMIHPNMGGVIRVGEATPVAATAPSKSEGSSSAGLAGVSGAAGLLGGAVLGLVLKRRRNGSGGKQA